MVVHLVPEWVRQAWAVPGLAAERRRVEWAAAPPAGLVGWVAEFEQPER